MKSKNAYLKSDWTAAGVNILLRHEYYKACQLFGTEPDYLIATNALGNVYPFCLCQFAIKHKMMLRFVSSDKWNDLHFYFAEACDLNDDKTTD